MKVFDGGLLRPYSEDYYGDLDLKAIRKSELLAGLNQDGPKPQHKASKPRPSAKAAQESN